MDRHGSATASGASVARWPGVPGVLDAIRARIDRYPLPLSCAFVFLPLFALYLATATYDAIQSPDPLSAAVPAWQYAVHGNFNLDEFEGMSPWFVEGRNHVVSERMPGIIFFAIPFYLLLPTPTEGPTVAPAALAAVLATVLAMTLLHAVFRRLVPTSTALLATLVAGLATATWTVSADALWAHGINQLWLSSALLTLGASAWATSGLFFGLTIFTRPHTALVAAVAGLYCSWTKRSVKPVALIGILSLAGMAAVVAYNARLFGGLSITGGYVHRPDEYLFQLTPLTYLEGVLGTLASPDRGILVLSPFLLLLLPGLPKAWRVAPDWVRAGALSGVVYMLIHIALNRFSGGNNFFSYRLPIEMLTLSSPLLLLAWNEWTAKTVLRRRAFIALVAISALVHALGAIHWIPTLDERSPWTNLKLLEAIQSAGVSALWLVLAVLSVAAFFLWRTGARTPEHQDLSGDARVA